MPSILGLNCSFPTLDHKCLEHLCNIRGKHLGKKTNEFWIRVARRLTISLTTMRPGESLEEVVALHLFPCMFLHFSRVDSLPISQNIPRSRFPV